MGFVDTLDKIKTSSSITIGHRDSSIPFSYLASINGPIGYSHDAALAVVALIETKLGMDLKIKYNLVTSQTRIPLVQNGTVDLECGSTTNNIERQQQVAFSLGTHKTNIRLLTKIKSGQPAYSDFSDLGGKNVVTTAGTTSERFVKIMNADQQMRMNIISAKDHGEAFQMLESGRAVAQVLDEALLAGAMAKARNPTEWIITGTPQGTEMYGLMFRRDDDQYKKLVNEALEDWFKSGAASKSYDKWFLQPIPPNNYNLDVPMSAEVKDLVAHPTDSA